jgi:aconitase A
MPKPSDETLNALRGVRTEIGAGMVLFPRTIEERTWNNAHDRANQIVQNYIDGNGLFQITARATPGPQAAQAPKV